MPSIGILLHWSCLRTAGYLTFALKGRVDEGKGTRDRWNLWLYDLEGRESRQITQGDDQRQAVWEDNTHILYKTTELDEAMRARGFEEEWTVYHRLNVCTGEEREAFRLPMSVSGLWKMDEGRYVFTGETHLDRPNLLELTGEALEKELVRRQQTKGYKVLTELPLCENGVGMFNQTRITLFLYLEATGEYRRITPEDYDVNHVNVRPGQVLFTAFPFRDIKPVTEGMYRWDAERNETETLITPDKYSIDYVGHLGRKALCLGLVMRDYGVYEHPTFFVVDENGEEIWAAMTAGSTPRWSPTASPAPSRDREWWARRCISSTRTAWASSLCVVDGRESRCTDALRRRRLPH